MNILVTGGAGFIGSHITHRLLELGHDVVVVDTLDPYYDPDIKRRNVDRCEDVGGDAYTFLEGSITDRELVDGLMSEHDIQFVYHEAAQAGVRTSVENPQKPNRINVEGLLNVLTAAVDNDVVRVVNASSSSVYGVAEYLPFDEEHPNNPQSPYGVSKLAAEHYCNVFNNLYDISTVNLRYFTVYGPYMRPNMAITNFTSRCLNGKNPVIFGDGEQTRDFTYIDDIVDANVALLDSDAGDGETFNVGSGDNININELAKHIIEKTGADVELEYESSKKGDARHTHADISKAREVLGYEPTRTIREGVSEFVDWYVENREWYEPLVLNS